MDWLFYALLTPFLYSLVVLIDKYILEKEMPSAWGLAIYTAFSGAIFGLTFWIIDDFQLLSATDSLLMLLIGITSHWGSILYFLALDAEESSIVMILLQVQPIFVLILSMIFLQDRITPLQFGGFTLVLTAAIGLARQEQSAKTDKLFSRSFWLIMACNLIWGSGIVAFKFVSSSNDFLTTASHQSWGVALGGVLVYIFSPRIRQSFHESLKNGRRAVGFVVFNETFFTIAQLISFLAVSLGPVALVAVAGSTQIFFGILLGGLLTLAFPTIFKEDISRAGLTRKLAWAALMFAGLWLISL